MWYAPFGDHDVSKNIFGLKIPWLHLLFSERYLVDILNNQRIKKGQKEIMTIMEGGMNQLSFNDYKDIIYNLDLKVEYFETNKTKNKLANLLDRIPLPIFMKNYFVRTIYCSLRK